MSHYHTVKCEPPGDVSRSTGIWISAIYRVPGIGPMQRTARSNVSRAIFRHSINTSRGASRRKTRRPNELLVIELGPSVYAASVVQPNHSA